MDRRRFLRGAGVLLAPAIGVAWGDDPPASGTEAARRARRFLVSLLDPDLGLLPEFRGSKVYWLYHDNYLASRVLERSDPATSRRIAEAIRGFGITGSGKIEILFGEAAKPLPFRQYRLDEVKRIGPKVIRTEVVGEAVLEDWTRYADLLFLAAIAEAGTARDRAQAHFEAGMKTWDGSGIRDLASEKGGLSATYKLALALIAAGRLGVRTPEHDRMRERLQLMQRPDGGFITDYDARGKPVGQANVETTSMAILALDPPAST